MKQIKTSLLISSLILSGLYLAVPGPAATQSTPLTAIILAPIPGQELIINEPFTFQGSASGGEAPYAFVWNFGDGTNAAGPSFVKTYTTLGPKTVLLTVTDFSGAQASVTIDIVVVSGPAPVPTVDLLANGSSGPITLTVGTAATLSWSSVNATACTASGAWSGSKPTSGSESTGALNTVGAFTYTLTCSGAGGSASDAVTINITAAPGATAVDLLVNGVNGPVTVATGTAATLSWTSSNATACTASGAWSGSKPTSGSESTGALNTVGVFTYTLTCTGVAGDASDSVIINVSAGGQPAPVISNITVTDITQTSAIVHWTTDIPADSRVIYDTVSHPTLGLPPNFGYAFSTPTSDTDPKVTAHAVTLTGLSPNTQYFFRVLSQS